MTKIILDTQQTINELITELKVDLNDPGEIDRINNVILQTKLSLDQITFDKINSLLVLQKFLIRTHYFLTKENQESEEIKKD